MKNLLLVLAGLALSACASGPKKDVESTQHSDATEPQSREIASSEQLGRPVYLNYCNGRITLNEAPNGDLSVQIEKGRCNALVVTDHTSGKVIKEYSIQGSSYTLSKNMLSALGSDCRVNFQVHDGRSSDRFFVYIPSCRPAGGGAVNGKKSYQLSGKRNCKLMVNGAYSGQNVDDSYCQGANDQSDVVSYEYSSKRNCKLMINGDYSNKNVDDHFCH